MERTILHCDLNNFFASVECLYNPKLKEVPMAVCGSSKNRHGIVLAKNEYAKKYGVITAEAVWQAQKKCPSLVIVSPHFDRYNKYSMLACQIYERFTDMVEPFGIDESWLDVTGSMHLFGSGKEIADNIREIVKNELGLTISVGVSFNKIFAKLGSDYKKPDATTVISHENYREIVFPMKVSDLLYVGKSSIAVLDKLCIKTIGQLAQFDKKVLSDKLGKMGEMIHDYANGIDNSPVEFAHSERQVKSVGNGMTFKRNLVGLDDISAGVLALSDCVASRLRKYGLKCQGVQVAIKDPKFKTISRQKKLQFATHLSREISDIALEIIKSSWDLKASIRMITITGINLVNENYSEQLCLFDDANNQKRNKQEKIEQAVDNIRNRYGKRAISFGSNVVNDLGINIESADEEE